VKAFSSQYNMTDFFNYEVADFQVLEDIEFDETIQRPEKVRYYTIEEQLTDAYEKMIPKGRVKTFQLQTLKKEVERLRDLYDTHVVPTADTYEIRESSYGTNLSWLFPVYATPESRPYNFATSWSPLFTSANAGLTGFYPRMLSALPKPFLPTTEGVPYAFTKPTEFLARTGMDPSRALPIYVQTRTQRHEDKTFTVLKVPVEGTADVVNFVGYYLAKRPLDIPNPMPDHPFFKANESTFVDSAAPLSEVVPSVDAVLTHGVPVTTDPYGEGMKYLKLYDIGLRNIPWSSWKSRFPPAEMVATMPPPLEIPYPAVEQDKPGEELTTTYKSTYAPGLSPRFWLQNQVDGGELVIRMLLSQAISNGSVQAVPGVDIGPVDYPDTTLEECSLTGGSFQDFVTKGIVRRTWGAKDVIRLQCAPLEFVKQERSRLGYTGRIQWKEDTATEILKTYRRALERGRRIQILDPRTPTPSKTPSGPESVVRKEVVEVLADSRRTPEDKLRDIKELVKETFLTNNLYKDAGGAYVMCRHTLAILAGDLATDRMAYYSTWTAIEGGARVCISCGEHVSNDVLMEQDEYDEDGFRIRRAAAFETTTFQGDSQRASFTSGLAAIRPAFQMTNAVDDMCYALLSILQLLPSVESTVPILQQCQAFVAELIAKKKMPAGSTGAHVYEGFVGIAATVFLIQSHVPALLPRRSFGSRPLTLSGYPRDADTPGEYTIIDSLLMVIRTTYEAYPTAITGPSAAVIREVLSNPNAIKKQVALAIQLILNKYPAMRRILTEAKAHVQGIPEVEQPKALIPLVKPPETFDTVRGYPECPSSRTMWNNSNTITYTQPSISLRPGLAPARTPVVVDAVESDRVVPALIPKASIQKRYALGKTIEENNTPPKAARGSKAAAPKALKMTVALKDDYRTNLALASRLSDMFQLSVDIRGVDPTQSPDELRDIAKGFVYDVLLRIQANEVKHLAFEKARRTDISLLTLFANPGEERSNVNTLRATERLAFVERMAAMSDMERTITQELLATGMAPYIMTNKDRELYAAELLSRTERSAQVEAEFAVDQEEMPELEADVGVGQPTEAETAEDDARIGADDGDYGNNAPLPMNEGRDYDQPQMNDDEENAI
jgi:hypothetical protein